MVAEVQKQLEVTDQLRGAMGGFKETLRNAAALFGGFQVGFTAVQGIQTATRAAMEFEQE